MAKGNLFQGMARGKVGDVVFYRMNGVQMSRVRNRAPKNPRTNEQMYQRAVISSVMKLYSAGKEIFDHSFQGYTIGEGCMRRFNSVNARILRQQIINDINEGKKPSMQEGRVVAPRSLYPTPLFYCQISEGTLTNPLFKFDDLGGGTSQFFELSAAWKGIEGADTMTVAAFFEKLGVYSGDIFTFIGVFANSNNVVYSVQGGVESYGKQMETSLDWLRLIVKDNLPTDKTLKTALISEIFNIEQGSDIFELAANNTLDNFFLDTSDNRWKLITLGNIRSRFDVDLRSTAYMYPMYSGSMVPGIVSSYILDAWANMVEKVGTSELILEGGDVATATTMNVRGVDNETIIPANVNEDEVPRTARHRGTRNEKNG